MGRPRGSTGEFVDRANKDRFPTWMCSVCGHLIARDAIQPNNPGRCAHPWGLRCPGHYEEFDFINTDPEAEPWEPGDLEAVDQQIATKMARKRIG